MKPDLFQHSTNALFASSITAIGDLSNPVLDRQRERPTSVRFGLNVGCETERKAMSALLTFANHWQRCCMDLHYDYRAFNHHSLKSNDGRTQHYYSFILNELPGWTQPNIVPGDTIKRQAAAPLLALAASLGITPESRETALPEGDPSQFIPGYASLPPNAQALLNDTIAALRAHAREREAWQRNKIPEAQQDERLRKITLPPHMETGEMAIPAVCDIGAELEVLCTDPPADGLATLHFPGTTDDEFSLRMALFCSLYATAVKGGKSARPVTLAQALEQIGNLSTTEENFIQRKIPLNLHDLPAQRGTDFTATITRELLDPFAEFAAYLEREQVAEESKLRQQQEKAQARAAELARETAAANAVQRAQAEEAAQRRAEQVKHEATTPQPYSMERMAASSLRFLPDRAKNALKPTAEAFVQTVEGLCEQLASAERPKENEPDAQTLLAHETHRRHCKALGDLLLNDRTFYRASEVLNLGDAYTLGREEDFRPESAGRRTRLQKDWSARQERAVDALRSDPALQTELVELCAASPWAALLAGAALTRDEQALASFAHYLLQPSAEYRFINFGELDEYCRDEDCRKEIAPAITAAITAMLDEAVAPARKAAAGR